MGEKVEDVIQHFVSAYYDPVKAHDYYMRTRQLTGRKPSITKGMTKEQKQIFAVSKSNIGVAKKAEVVSNRSAEVARLNALRQTAKEAQDKIKAQMTALFASFQGDKVKTAVAKKMRPQKTPNCRCFKNYSSPSKGII